MLGLEPASCFEHAIANRRLGGDMRDGERFESLAVRSGDATRPAPSGTQVDRESPRPATDPRSVRRIAVDARGPCRIERPSTACLLRALAKAPRAGKSRAVPARDRSGRASSRRRVGLKTLVPERQRQALAGIDQQLERPMPQPVGIEGAAVAAKDRGIHR